MLIEISDASQAGEARRQAIACAEQLDLGDTDRGAVAIVVTEMATNLVKHAQHGSILLCPFGTNGDRGLRVLSMDKGPGIQSLSAALEDGHSTAGTMGTGLGAIRRLSHNFEIYSGASGTAIVSEFWTKGKAPNTNSALQVGTVSLPITGEEVNGDGWGTRVVDDIQLFMVVDGLGHGAYAAEAAREAERVVAATRESSPTAILRDCHDAVRKTRGAAIGLAALDMEHGVMRYAGIGNVAAVIVSPNSSRSMTPHNGILGHEVHKFQEFSYPWNPDSILIMHSDGVTSRWALDRYPGIWSKHPALIAGLLYRDFARGRDDATVLVAKNRQ